MQQETERPAPRGQATFLRGPSAAAAPDSALQAELEALPQEALETRCQRSGLSRRGSRADMVRASGLTCMLGALSCVPPGPKVRWSLA